jgi:hypothetical protein
LEVSNRQYRNEGKVKTIDVAELYQGERLS